MSILDVCLKELSRIKNGDVNTDFGICNNVDIPWQVLEFAFPKWSKFSGVINFPVPDELLTPEAAYNYGWQDDGLWSKETQYGKDRYELLDFLIEFFKQCEIFVVSNMSVTPIDEYTGCNEDVFKVLVHPSSVPEELQDLECLVKAWQDKKLLEQYSSFCIEVRG